MMSDSGVAAEKSKKKHRYSNKDAIEDDPSIDKWAPVPISREDVKKPFLEVSKFATLFPKYREAYLQEKWPQVESVLRDHGIMCELNIIEGSMTVMTSRKTFDPYIIIKARDMIKLLSRSVPLDIAQRILDDEIYCDIIKIKGLVNRPEVYIKRRQRLVGPEGSTLKALELLTECYIYIQGGTVAVLGPAAGMKKVRRVVVNTMKNVHPIYEIKKLMIQRELEKDPELKNENWERFLPQFKKKNIKKKKTVKRVDAPKKEKSLFPPAPTPSKVDLQIESGEYFLSKRHLNARARKEKQKEQDERKARKAQERGARFVAPQKRKRGEEEEEEEVEEEEEERKQRQDQAELDRLQNKFKKNKSQ